MKIKKRYFVGAFLAYAAGSIALVYSATHSSIPASSSAFTEGVKTFFLCLGGLGILAPLSLNVMNAVEQRKYDKIENTFALVSKWDDSHLLAARNYTRDLGKKRTQISDDELIKQIEADSSLQQSVILVTNFLEHVRFSIENQRIDLVELKKSLGGTLTAIIDRFWPYYGTLDKSVCGDLSRLKDLLK